MLEAPQSPAARTIVLFAAVLAVASACAGNRANRPAAATPSTLDSARRVRYLVAAQVEEAANAPKRPGTADQLRTWVERYMAQVGLPLAQDAQHPYDVEVRLSLSARGGPLLLHGTAGMKVLVEGKALDEWSAGDHIEPAGAFPRAVARELVEAMVHSKQLAGYADSKSAPSAAPTPTSSATATTATTTMAPPDRVQVVAATLPPPPPPPAVSTSLTAGPERNTTGARAHTRQGSAYYDLQRFHEAYVEFEQAYLLEQDPALLYNMGQCQRKLGNAEEALHFYKTYVRRAPTGPTTAEAQNRIRELESALARGRK